ncbi:MAG: hypothetical protein R2789_15760 [Microthrixaceae bacterium]
MSNAPQPPGTSGSAATPDGDSDLDLTLLEPVEHPPVEDWTTDLDHTINDYAQRHTGDLGRTPRRMPRGTHRTLRWFAGSQRHEDVSAIAHDTENFSSRDHR